ncbi:YmaF family protein [Brevibacillus sp. NRS-1366]|uniref:YmaF family protein n=1 Tax=Brevibacillus sp. NRS-1366 TaxID=3233899 RepID=UPI003D261BED
MKARHSHLLRFVRITDIPGHLHSYDTPTTVNDRHRHRLRGNTSPPQGAGNEHVHYYQGTTTFNDGHVHYYSGWTGPPIPLPDGSHYHEFSGQTTYDDGHIHYYRGITSEAFL